MLIAIYLLLITTATWASIPLDHDKNKVTAQFINTVSTKHKIPKPWLKKQFSGLYFNERAIALIQKPAEGKAWPAYRKLFITPKRIHQGQTFISQHQNVLRDYEKKFGIPKEIVVAIMGIETNYGATQGDFNALEALSTLAFYYVPRHSFFESELVALVNYAWRNQLDLHTLTGSYAGALGIMQFMPSNLLLYATSAAKTKDIDIFTNPNDAIASINVYLTKHGHWLANQPVIASLELTSSQWQHINKHYPNKQTIKLDPKLRNLLNLKVRTHPAQWLIISRDGTKPQAIVAFPNFSSILSYNNSFNYARSVYELSQALKK